MSSCGDDDDVKRIVDALLNGGDGSLRVDKKHDDKRAVVMMKRGLAASSEGGGVEETLVRCCQYQLLREGDRLSASAFELQLEQVKNFATAIGLVGNSRSQIDLIEESDLDSWLRAVEMCATFARARGQFEHANWLESRIVALLEPIRAKFPLVWAFAVGRMHVQRFGVADARGDDELRSLDDVIEAVVGAYRADDAYEVDATRDGDSMGAMQRVVLNSVADAPMNLGDATRVERLFDAMRFGRLRVAALADSSELMTLVEANLLMRRFDDAIELLVAMRDAPHVQPTDEADSTLERHVISYFWVIALLSGSKRADDDDVRSAFRRFASTLSSSLSLEPFDLFCFARCLRLYSRLFGAALGRADIERAMLSTSLALALRHFNPTRIVHPWQLQLNALSAHSVADDASSSSSSSMKTCARCKRYGVADDAPLKNCALCKSTSYCSVSCQRLDWPEHRKHCIKT
jgi:MYND finger